MKMTASDRTEDFKDAIRKAALSYGNDEAKLAAVLASFIIRKPPQISDFIKSAIKTLENIRELELYLSKHKKDYVDPYRTTQREKDSIESEVSSFIKSCKDQIDILKNSIGKSNADTIAHKHGVLLIASERLEMVTKTFDQLRAIRLQDAIEKISRRRVNVKNSQDSVNSNVTEERVPRVQEQILDDETRDLETELNYMIEAARQTEERVVEMSALNHIMATHVSQQAQQIEMLYDKALEAANNIELGNKEISKAIDRNSSSRTFLLLFLFVLTFSVLFLDWYS